MDLYDLAQAVAAAERESKHPSADLHNLCLKTVRGFLRIPALYPSAIAAWSHVPVSERHGGTPPAGYPVFWRVGQYGHVAISAGNGNVWSTDIKRRGKVDLVPISLITERWGARLLGWTTSLNGVELPTP